MNPQAVLGGVTPVAVLAIAGLAIPARAQEAPTPSAPSSPAVARWVDGPGPDARPPLYPGARAPLRPLPFPKLPVGAVRPQGWLRACLERQRDGMTGALPRLSAWLQKEDNAWLAADGEGRWGWEELPYWLRGYLEMGHLLDDPEMLAEARVWIEGVLGSQRADGDFGPARRFEDDGSRDFWANMVMLHCLRTHHEATGDPRVLALMREYFRFQLGVPDEEFLTHYWQNRRAGDQLDVVHWLYARTGDAFLLELAEKLHRNTLDWAPVDGHSADRHNVNVAQGFREPAQWWRQSGDPADLQATYDAFRVVRTDYGPVPGGMFGGDEVSRPGFDDPRQAIETCALVEQIRSDGLLFRVTGDPFWAGHAETVAFDQLPSAFLPDFRGLRYLGSPNQVTSDAANHAPGIFNGGPYLILSAVSHRCCQHNHAHGFSGFAQELWTATSDRGLCATSYAAAQVRARVGDGRAVGIAVDSRYPFEEEVRMRVSLEGAEPLDFPLYLRVPDWCAAPRLWVNGEAVEIAGARAGFVRLARPWQDGDRLRLRLPMPLEVRRWEAQHGAASVHRGPLTFGLRIPVRRVERDAAETALGGSRWQEDVDLSQWPAVELFPDGPWNYGLVLGDDPEASLVLERAPWPEDDFPFTPEAAPLRLRATGRRIPEWRLDRYGLCAELQDSPVASDQADEEIVLVPMGAARLRITAFPVIAGPGEEGVRWSPPAEPKELYEASASHCWQGDQVEAIADDLVPEDSNDHSVPRHTFWPRRGTTEWLQAEFAEPRAVDRVAVYWFDDRATGGGCRVPAAARLLMRVDGAWVPVPGAAAIGTARDRFNAVEFPEVVTDALRLEVDLQDGRSAGVLEWRVD